jgi:glycogen(starch) synthase
MTADTVGGVWSYAMELCSSLRPLGAEVALATLGGPLSRDQRREADRLPHIQVYESDYRLEWMPSPWDSLALAGEWLLSIENELSPTVVHLNHLVHAELQWQAPVIVVGHSCVFSWWKAVRGGRPDPSWAQYRRRVATSLRSATRVVAPSRAMLSALCHHYGPLQRTQVIPNARDPGNYQPGRKQPMIFSAGRLWDEAKNVRTLCEVAPSIAWPVFVAGADVGPDGQRPELKDVTQLGQLSSEAMSRWLAQAAIYAAPARYEPFGLSALEAALSGCALVLGDIESLREVWGNAALYAAPDSVEDLRDALADLIAHPAAIPVFAKRARSRANQFNPQQLASAYWSLYRSVCEPREPAQCASYCSITH